MDPVALALLALEIRDLRELAAWEQVGGLLEELVATAHGHGGLSEDDVHRLRSWARRWRTLPAELRAFYVAHAAEHEAASVALWYVLQGTPWSIAPGTAGAVHHLYREHAARMPPWSLFPRVP
jgi:hypothetical protein